MHTAYVAVAIITIALNAGVAIADFIPARFVLANSSAVGVPESALPMLGALKAAGAGGLLIGLVALPTLGIAAAIGLTLFFTGALAAHLRARVLHNLHYPGAYWLLAVATLLLAVAAR